MFIKIVIAIFVIFVLSRVFLKYKKREITALELLAWVIFWILVLAASLWPHATDKLAVIVGVGRGADLLIFISIVVLFFAVFRILVQLKKIEREITKVVRETAIERETKRNITQNQAKE